MTRAFSGTNGPATLLPSHRNPQKAPMVRQLRPEIPWEIANFKFGTGNSLTEIGIQQI